jgi:DNA-binding GntR family transcriptional regulator
MSSSYPAGESGIPVRGIPEHPAAFAGNPNISEGAFQRIRDLIVHGKLAPGSRVIEADLANRLGISRTPVRSALHRLRQEGYIIVVSGGGNKARLAVAPLTQDDARELYRIVGHLEGLAARSTAQLEPTARAALAEKLRSYNAGLQELAETKRAAPNRTFELDMNFHLAIVHASAGPRLLAIHGAVKPQAERYWRLYATAIIDQLGLSVSEHFDIINAIENGEPEAAERATQLNWQNGAERLCEVIRTLGERGSW